MDIPLEACEAVRTTTVGHRILDAAGRLFYEQGITATGVDLVVEVAGTTKRTLYQRFGSKDALVAAYLQDRAHRWQAQLLGALDALGSLRGDAGAAEAIDVVYRQARDWATTGGRGCAFVNAWAELDPQTSAGAAVVQAEKGWMLALFTHLVDGDRQLARTLHLLYEGAQVTAAISGDPQSFDTALQASHALLTR